MKIHYIDPECTTCNGSGWIIVNNPFTEKETDYVEQCPDCEKKQIDKGVMPFPGVTIQNYGWENVSIDEVKKVANSIVKNYEHWQSYGKGLYIYSATPGSGKSRLACAVARSIALQYKKSIDFVTTTGYINSVKASYKEDSEINTDIYYKTDVLILDDLGSERTTEWSESALFDIINYRYEDKKITLFTSNLDADSMNYHDRLVDRILSMSYLIKMPERSMRGIMAKKSNEEFLKLIERG